MKLIWLAAALQALIFSSQHVFAIHLSEGKNWHSLQEKISKDPQKLSALDLLSIMREKGESFFDFIEEVPFDRDLTYPLQALSQKQLQEFADKKKFNPCLEIPEEVLLQASGKGRCIEGVSSDLWQSLQQLFYQVVVGSVACGVPLQINRFDLFHGHVYLLPKKSNADQWELFIIFHAKECPGDLPIACGKNSYFTTLSSFYPKRNYIYLSSLNKIFLLEMKPHNPVFESFGFPYGVSGELRNVLRPALARATFLREEYFKNDAGAVHIGDLNMFSDKTGKEYFFLRGN